MCGAMTFWVPLQYRVSAGLVIYVNIPRRIYKEQGYDSQQAPRSDRAFSRADMDEKLLSPLFPISGGGGGGGQWLQMTVYTSSPVPDTLQNHIPRITTNILLIGQWMQFVPILKTIYISKYWRFIQVPMKNFAQTPPDMQMTPLQAQI